MNELTLTNRYLQLRQTAFEWRKTLAPAKKLALTVLMAGITGLMAQVVIPLPWTPVPVTGQTFAVLLAGILLGKWWGGLSQIMYVVLGVAGLPWFNGATGGVEMIAGPTGGYLVGFVLAALFIGYMSDRTPKSRKFLPMTGLMLFANFALIYIPGMLQLALWFNVIQGNSYSLVQILMMGMVPFIIGDVVKILAAAFTTKIVTPKK